MRTIAALALAFIAAGLFAGTATAAPKPTPQRAAPGDGTPLQLGAPSFNDIETSAFIVLTSASRSSQDDLRAIMAGVKAINQAKTLLRENLSGARKLPPSPCAGAAALRACVRAARYKLADMEIASIDLMRGSVIAAQSELAQLADALRRAPDEAERLRQNLPPPARPLPSTPCKGWNVGFWKLCLAAVNVELAGNLPDAASEALIAAHLLALSLQIEGLSDPSDLDHLSLAMDRISALMSALSNISRKLSDTAEAVAQNLK